jgi:hypothetical protein
MSGAKTAGEMSVCPGMIEVQTGVGVFMSYPTPVRVHVGRIRMAGHIAESVLFAGSRSSAARCRTVLRNESVPDRMTALMPALLSINSAYKREQQ